MVHIISLFDYLAIYLFVYLPIHLFIYRIHIHTHSGLYPSTFADLRFS